MNFLRFLFFSLVIGLYPCFSDGQISASSDQSISNAKELYQNTIAADSHLYTGEAYYGYNTSIKGTAFFISDSMRKNKIFYDGTLYNNVPLLFDIVKQKVVITRLHSNQRIQLVNDKIRYFTCDGHRFENFLQLMPDGTVSSNIYDVMYTGTTSVLIKRTKAIKESIRAEGATSFVEQDQVFVKKNNSMFEIKNRNSLIDVFADKKNQVKSFIRKKKFRFKKQLEKEVIVTAAYYETLNK